MNRLQSNIDRFSRQAAAALKAGNFEAMNQFDQQAIAARSQKHENLFTEMKQQVAKIAPTAPPAVNLTETRRVFRVAR